MMTRRRRHREIAGLADGSLDTPGLRERIAGEPVLASLLHEQERAVAVTRAARPQAPQALRTRLAAAPPAPTRTRTQHNRRPLAGFAVALAGVLGLGVVAVLPSTAAPSVTAVARLAGRGPTAPPPQSDPAHRGAVRSQLDGLRYPYWEDAFGWRTSGTRADQVDGRTTMTVYYANATTTVDYTIVAGRPLAEPAATSTAEQSHGIRFVGLTAGDRTIVTWRRAGHTCVVSATHVPLATLLRLAEWRYDASPA